MKLEIGRLKAMTSADAKARVFRSVQPLVLASSSPRRRELLLSMGLTFDVVPSRVDETVDAEGDGYSLVEKWATEKAEAVSEQRPASWVLGADTIVLLDGRVFGKPSGYREAAFMLRELSGRTHEVVSSVCLTHRNQNNPSFSKTLSVITRVTFRVISDREIDAYVGTGEPLDKAGAYGIQGRGAFLVKSVQGSYTNVVGLPLCETVDLLLEEGVIVAEV
jgi:septum formation protein